jgi:hypothetical protein
MATPQRQNRLDSQGARTPMNGEPRTDLIQLITRTESLSGDDESRRPARPTLIRGHKGGDTGPNRVTPRAASRYAGRPNRRRRTP